MADVSPRAFADLATVLVAVDFSDTSALAYERACQIASSRGSKLLVVHILPSAPLAIHGVQPVLPPPSLAGRIRELAEQKLGALVAAAGERGISAESVLTVGSAGHSIVDVAVDRGVDLIVIGTRGLTGVKHLVLGSTAEHAVRHASCPVLTVHPDDLGSFAEPSTAIVPIELHGDPTATGRLIGQVLGDAAVGVKVLLVYCDHLPAVLQPWLGDLGLERIGFEEIRERVEGTVAPAAEALRGMGFEVETVIQEGEPASVVTELARARKADLIAMPTHARTGAAHLLLGSTAERVVQHAGCAVLTLHGADTVPAPGS